MINEVGEETSNRVSVWVVEAGDGDATWNHGHPEQSQSRELAVLTQQAREDALTFAERVTDKVARLAHNHIAPERLALVLQDDLSPSTTGLHSEALSMVALHLVQSRTPLTIRILAE